VTALRPGDEIVAATADCLRSHSTVPLDRLYWLPRKPRYGFLEQAAMPVAFLTAIQALRDVARLRRGERVLIHAAGGSVGLAAVQVAHHLGADIIATAGSDEKRRLLEALGVRHILPSRTLAFADAVLEITGGRGVDVVLSFLPGEMLHKSIAALAPFGRLVDIGKRDIEAGAGLPLGAFGRALSYAAVDFDRHLAERGDDTRAVLADIWEGLEGGWYAPIPITVHPLGALDAACRDVSEGRRPGRVMLDFADPGLRVRPEPRDAAPFRRDASYLVTGGLGGFGLETARWMAAQGAGTLILASRRGVPDADAAPVLDEIRRLGVRVEARVLDVADPAAVRVLVAEIGATLPPLRGVVHAAMVLDDAVLANQTPERLAAVMAPKAAGAWALHEAVRGLPLDHFLLFSSVSALTGSSGQANYVAANTFLDALAARRRAEGLPALSIQWGAIADAGVVARSADLARHLDGHGVKGLAARPALDALAGVLGTDRATVGIIAVDWARWGEANPALAARARFAAVAATAAHADAGGDADRERHALAALPAADREAALLDVLVAEAAAILRQPPVRVPPDRLLPHLGFDSLMAVELQTAIAGRLGIRISALEMIREVSLAQLARQAAARLDAAAPD
jgi:NADPH:quinone reductase-like Zn-dependent oxidoreductase/acyl carrier protein